MRHYNIDPPCLRIPGQILTHWIAVFSLSPIDNPLSTSVFPVIPQISAPLRYPYRFCSIYFWVSLISSSDSIYLPKTNTALVCDIALIAILSPDAATQTHLVFGGPRKHGLQITGRVNIQRASVWVSPTVSHIHKHTICKKSHPFSSSHTNTPTDRSTIALISRSQSPSSSTLRFGGRLVDEVIEPSGD